ncbi:MAG: hypothetical protein DRN03_05305, partial [Thermoplasmata archaeon]
LGERAHFTVTPLGFIPMAGLKEGNFFDANEHLTKGRILHIYHAWRHLAYEVDRGLKRVAKENPNLAMFLPLAKFGSRLVVQSIRKWAMRRGVDVDKPLDLMDIRIEEIDMEVERSFSKPVATEDKIELVTTSYRWIRL